MLLPSRRRLPLRGLEWSFEQLEDDPEISVELSNEMRNTELAEQSFKIINEKSTAQRHKLEDDEEEKSVLI